MKQKGFSLIELLIVVTLVGIIAAIAVPNFISAKRSANEGSAIGSTKVILGAQTTYVSTTGVGDYGDLIDLASTRSIDILLGAGVKSGYTFEVVTFAKSSTQVARFDLSVNAAIFGNAIAATGNRNFYSNESSVIYENRNGQDNPPSSTSATNRIVINGTPID